MKSTLVIMTLNEIEGLRNIFANIPLDKVDEVLAIDGGSTDGTIEFFKERNIRVIIQEKKGRGDAFRIAARETKGRNIIFFSPDGNEDPQDIPKLLAKLDEGCDMVIGSRFMPGGRNEEDDKIFAWRAWINRAFTLTANLIWNRKAFITDTINGYRAVTKEAFSKINPDAPGFVIEYQMSIRAMKLGLNVTEIPTYEGSRIAGESSAKSIPTGLLFLRFLIREILYGKKFLKEQKKGLNLKSPTFLLLSIILLGLFLRLVNILSPILDLYPIRQEYCAMVARNFFRHGLNIFNPQVDWVGNLNSYWSAELPLVSFITALLYKIFGIHEYLGRLVAIFFSVCSIYLLYKLADFYFGRKTALFSSFCFAVLPWSVYFGRTFMPESTTIFFLIASLYLLSLWVENNKDTIFVLAIFVTATAFLTKISTLFLCLPLLFLFYIKYNKRFLLHIKTWIFFILAVIPSLFWYSRSNIEMGFYIFDPENLSYLISLDFYRRIFENISIFILTPLGFVFFLLAVVLKVKNKVQYLFHFWFISVIIYIMLYPKLNYTHYYYQLPLIPICAVFIGKALALIDREDIIGWTIFHKFLNTRKITIVILTYFVFYTLIVLRPCYKWNRATYEAGRLINRLTAKNSIIIAGRCTQEAPLYYCDRKGWVINEYGQLSYVYGWAHKDQTLKNLPILEEIELVRYLIKHQGADYYLATNLKALNENPALVGYLRDNFPVLCATDKYIIFKLKK